MSGEIQVQEGVVSDYEKRLILYDHINACLSCPSMNVVGCSCQVVYVDSDPSTLRCLMTAACIQDVLEQRQTYEI